MWHRTAHASFVPHASLVLAINVATYLLAHALLNGHAVLARRQALVDARNAGPNKNAETAAASTGPAACRSKSRYRAVRAAYWLYTWLSNFANNSRVMRYWFEPLPQSGTQAAQEAWYYGRMMSVLALGAMLIPVVSGGVVISTFLM